MLRRVTILIIAVFCFVPVLKAENLFDIISEKKPSTLLKLMKAIRSGADVNQPGKDGENLLAMAIFRNGDRTIIRALIDAGAKLDAETEGQLMPAVAFNRDASLLRFLASMGFKVDNETLRAAIYNEDFRMFKTALDLCENPVLKNEFGFSFLHLASLRPKNPLLIAYLLKNGLGPNDETRRGDTPLLRAAEENIDQQIVSMLIMAGGNLEKKDQKGRTPLFLAIYYNKNPEVAIALIKHGAKVNTRDDKGNTPLMYSALKPENAKLVETLLRYGAKIDARDSNGATALMWACSEKDNDKIVKILLEAGANPNLVAKNGFSAIDAAIDSAVHKSGYSEAKSVKTVELLMKHGAKLTRKHDRLTKGWLLAASSEDGLPLVKKLLDKGVDINSSDKDGITALMEAAINNADPQMTAFLLQAGAKVDLRSRHGFTALSYATQYNNSTIVKLLLNETEKLGGNPKSDPNLLLSAACNDDVEVIRLFLADSNNVDCFDEQGRTPLIWAARASTAEVVKALIDAGADVNHRSSYGISALLAAAEMNISPEIIRVLVEAGAQKDFRDPESGKTALEMALENESLKGSEAIDLLR